MPRRLNDRAGAARRRLLGSAAALTATVWTRAAAADAVLTVAAASNLKFALEAIAAGFERDTGTRLRLVFGSSGQFTTQILQGAPFHVFLSADEDFVLRLAAAGRTEDRGRVYALGRIAILVPHGSPLKPDGRLQDLAAALRDGRLMRLAIANPAHAPYGDRARQALRHAGLWPAIEPRLVLGENVAQAVQFALSGSAQGGIVAQSLAVAPTLAARSRLDPIPADWHTPLRHRMCVLRGAPPAARRFFEHLSTAAAQAVLLRHGFEMPRA